MIRTATITQLSGSQAQRTIVVRQSQIGPDGPSASVAVITASEALSAGDVVNVYDNAGVLNARRASAAAGGYEASGFVLEAVSSGLPATVYFSGRNDGQAGLAPGRVFLSTVPGRVQSVPPGAAGQVVQQVGHALTATSLILQLGIPVRLSQ